ncbi:MAG: hypothetical protein HY718_00785 [Planctomycetes bacterium]|nr:hypothetical protein [Planctomycetota bacterium]
MTPQNQRDDTLDVLNKLYAAEKRSLLPRLAEMGVFAQWALAHEMEQVRRMAADQALHEAWLLEAAEACGGALRPACADVTTANLHYLDLQTLLPRVVAGVEHLVQLYDRTMREANSLLPEAAETVARIYNRHQAHIEQLRGLCTRMQHTVA